MRLEKATKKYLFAIALAVLTGGLALVVPTAHAQSVTSLACSPSIIDGGSGGAATCTVTLSAAAPAGGTVATLTSSLPELAASVPRITVPAGQTTANFTVGTNANYRRYSGLAFNVIISATQVATANATLTVTAQPMPPDFNSGSTAGANTQWSGLMCGGIAPIGGDLNILYSCSPAPSDTAGFGSCTFQQECPIGCRRVPPSGGTFNDFCATTGPNPISISRNYIISGDRVPTTLQAEAPVALPTRGVPRVGSLHASSFSRADVGGIPFPTGATSVPFEVVTSYVPSPEFVDVGGFWFDDSIPPLLITSGRGGHAWIAMVPPDPPPALPIPTFVDFGIHGVNLGGITVSGFSAGGGPTVSLTSSHPDIVLGPTSVVVNSSHVSGNQVEIFTQPPAVATEVTITATDGRYTASGVMTVQPPSEPSPPPAVAVSVNPSGVVGGSSATGTVTLGAPQTFNPDGTVVTLASSNPAVATVPASVTVPAGTATTANFTVTTSSVPASTSVIITADCCNLRATTAISVTTAAPPPASPLALALSPASVAGGTSSTGTVTLDAAAPAGGALVKLSSSNAAARVPLSVTVPAGATSATFAVATNAVTALTTATIAAVSNNQVWNAVLAVNPPTVQAPTLAAIMLNPATVPAGANSTGTVTLNTAAPAGGAEVTLSSYRTSATVPTSVTVPPGAASASFTVATNAASHPGTITISAVFAGVRRVAELMTTVPTDPNAALATFTLGQTSATGGTVVSANVTLTGPAPSSGAGGAEITVTSSNTAVARIPPGVIVGTGQTSADFSIITSSVSVSTAVTLTASFGGVTLSRVLTVNPPGGAAPTLSAVSLNPTSVVGGSSSTGTVTLSAAAPSGGAVVTLSDNSSATTVPASVTVPAGATSANFTVTTSLVTASTAVSISGSFGGTTRSATLTVNPPAPAAPTLISPAASATPAQPVTFDWSDVADATSYEIQVDDSSTIAAPFTANQSVSVSQITIGGLPAQRLWWRVRAQNSAGVFGPFSATRRFTPQAAPAAASLSSVFVNPTSVVGGNSSTGTVTLTAAAPTGGAVVTLSSSNPAVAGVPASVTVLAGATSATVTVSTTAVTANASVTLTGTYSGVSRTATLTVTPPPPPSSLSAVSVNPTSVVGGNSSTGTVTLTSAAPAGGTVVTLTSSSTSATVPGSVTVAAGATTATFTITTSTVTASTATTISAVFAGVTRTATLTVNPASANATLTVTATGRSGERVTSSPTGINVAVGSTASASFATNTSITLSVSNGRDAIWSGACSSGSNKTKTCTFTLNANATVTANVQ